MSKFFVGQRVRVVRSFSGNQGKSGVLVNHNPECDLCWECRTDDNRFGWGYPDCFEPILPEGMQPVPLSVVIDVLPELESILGVTA